jgi:hypothetical protein
VGHEVTTVEDAGLKGLKTGVLLRTGTGSYDALVTVDQNFPHQHNMSSFAAPFSFDSPIVVLAIEGNAHTGLR